MVAAKAAAARTERRAGGEATIDTLLARDETHAGRVGMSASRSATDGSIINSLVKPMKWNLPYVLGVYTVLCYAVVYLYLYTVYIYYILLVIIEPGSSQSFIAE